MFSAISTKSLLLNHYIERPRSCPLPCTSPCPDTIFQVIDYRSSELNSVRHSRLLEQQLKHTNQPASPHTSPRTQRLFTNFPRGGTLTFFAVGRNPNCSNYPETSKCCVTNETGSLRQKTHTPVRFTGRRRVLSANFFFGFTLEVHIADHRTIVLLSTY